MAKMIDGIEFIGVMKSMGYDIPETEDINIAFITIMLDLAKRIDALDKEVKRLKR